MARTVTKDSTFEQIGDVVYIKLLGEFMDGRMDLDEFRIISRGLSGLFSKLHVDQLNYENSGIPKEGSYPDLTAPKDSKMENERMGNFVDVTA